MSYWNYNLVWMLKLEKKFWWSWDRMKETLGLLSVYSVPDAGYSLYSLFNDFIHFTSVFQLRKADIQRSQDTCIKLQSRQEQDPEH